MAVAPNTGMSKQDMKRLLMRSKEEPVTCAIGVGDIGGLMVLDKRKPGRALESGLKADFPDARNTRFGTAFVDVDDDPKLVKLTLNKPVTGMAKRLIKTLKGTGFNKVIILTEDGSVMEQFEEEDEEAAAAEAGATAAAPAPPPPPPEAPPAPESAEDKAARAGELIAKLKELSARIPGASFGDPARQEEFAKLARMAGVQLKTGNLAYGANSIEQLERALATAPPPPPAPPPPAGPTPGESAARVAELTAQLRELVPQIAPAAGGDAARMATLAKLAKDAGVEIKTGNLSYATNTIERLRTALGSGATAGSSDAEAPSALAASRVSWTTMRQQVAADVDKLSAALAQAYAGQSFAGEIEQRFRVKVAPMLAQFDDKLGSVLDDLAEAAPDRRAELTTAARAQVNAYRSFAQSDTFIGDLDSNPFVPVGIRARAIAALSQVEQALS